ncbi:MAG: hypothetical protein OXT49_03825 [Gammaproteobacteria bacterium]|nr:hypothetical protein [Gammaproteobacteria bacterium]
MTIDPASGDFWDKRGDLLPHAAEMGPLSKGDVDRLFRRERVRLVIRDKNRAREIDVDESLQFWEAYARNHTVKPDQTYITASSMSGEVAYRASEWYDGRGAAVVLLEIIR